MYNIQITNTTKEFKIHYKILSILILNMYLKYYLKYMYFKILPITGSTFVTFCK